MLGLGLPGVIEVIIILVVSAVMVAVIWCMIRLTRSTSHRREQRGFDVTTNEEHRKP